jgi:muconolactone delta-isomerase
MNQFMVEINLPDQRPEDFIKLIPSHRAHINRLLARGIILSYSLSLDRKKVWSVITGRNESEVERVLQNFPIINWLNYDIHELAFNNNMIQILPKFSLN